MPEPPKTPPPDPPDPKSTSKSSSSSTSKPSSSRKRAARKAFDEKSERAQMKETLKLRNEYPKGAILMAAGQALRLEDQNDSAYVLKKMVAEPEIATKARKAIKLDKPGKKCVYEMGRHNPVLPTLPFYV